MQVLVLAFIYQFLLRQKSTYEALALTKIIFNPAILLKLFQILLKKKKGQYYVMNENEQCQGKICPHKESSSNVYKFQP